MAYPAVVGIPASGLQPPYPYQPFGPAGPLFVVLLTQLETTTTPKPPSIGTQVVVVPNPPYPYPYPYPPGLPVPGAPDLAGCSVNCPAAWDPVCSVNGAGLMYNFANLCALNAQNCVSRSDFRYLYSGICRLKKR